MIQAQRARHFRTWVLLGPALICAVVALIALRPPPPDAGPTNHGVSP